MSATRTCRVLRPDPGSLDRREQHHRATLTACHLSDTTVLVAVKGEVDAANSRALSDYVERQVARWPELVLDLSGVEFFGTAGFATLHHVNVICAQYRAKWALRRENWRAAGGSSLRGRSWRAVDRWLGHRATRKPAIDQHALESSHPSSWETRRPRPRCRL